MKKILFLVATVVVMASCNNNDDDTASGIISTWKLTEVLMDPGDGSGTFMPVESNKTITFYEDGTVTSNGNLCDMSITTGTPSTGTYSETESTIHSESCENNYEYTYELQGSELTISYPCIEPCIAKYVRVNN